VEGEVKYANAKYLHVSVSDNGNGDGEAHFIFIKQVLRAEDENEVLVSIT
jgi:hypothetical protein